MTTTLPPEPPERRAFAYFDAQNLFNAAKEAFSEFEGYDEPTYDPLKIAEYVCRIQSWRLDKVHLYTGIPEQSDRRHAWWNRKLQVLGSRGVETFARPLRYREQQILLRNGTSSYGRVGREKGIDVRLALDMVRHALESRYDVALVFSQDQDLSEAVKDITLIGQQQGRWIKVASAFPVGASKRGPDGFERNERGINGTKVVKIPKAAYDACIDPLDYSRPLTPGR